VPYRLVPAVRDSLPHGLELFGVPRGDVDNDNCRGM
jgi:hypothetical protein